MDNEQQIIQAIAYYVEQEMISEDVSFDDVMEFLTAEVERKLNPE